MTKPLFTIFAATLRAMPPPRRERGRYLMSSIVACGYCYTLQGPNGPVQGKELTGGLVFDEAPSTAVASNITPGKETGIGS